MCNVKNFKKVVLIVVAFMFTLSSLFSMNDKKNDKKEDSNLKKDEAQEDSKRISDIKNKKIKPISDLKEKVKNKKKNIEKSELNNVAKKKVRTSMGWEIPSEYLERFN